MTFDTGEPASRDEILAALVRLNAEADAYLGSLPTAVFLERQGEKWSPADQLRHLSKSTSPLVGALGLPRVVLRVLFGRSRSPSRSFTTLREVYRGKLLEGATAGKFAPSPRPRPADPEAWRAEVMSRWRAGAAAFHRKVASWPDEALDHYRLPHPLLGRLTVREMLFFTLYHNAHHLQQVASRAEERV